MWDRDADGDQHDPHARGELHDTQTTVVSVSSLGAASQDLGHHRDEECEHACTTAIEAISMQNLIVAAKFEPFPRDRQTALTTRCALAPTGDSRWSSSATTQQ